MHKSKTFFNLPKKVIFCKKCVSSNQLPRSIPEFTHTKDRKGAKYLNFGTDGICDPARFIHKETRSTGDLGKMS